MNELVSVIIPVYNCELYLDNCIRSVINQQYKKLEIILVDDGSTDLSGDVCDRFAVIDRRIKVIHKINGGVSSARNAGIAEAKGRYICFVDSDDLLPLNSIKTLVEILYNKEVDYVAGVIVQSDNRFKALYEEMQIDYSINPADLLYYITLAGSRASYGKLYKTHIIKEQKLFFDETLKCLEDAVFTRTYLKFCKKIYITSSVVYCYNIDNEDSLSKKHYNKYSSYYCAKLNVLEELLDVLDVCDSEKERFITERAINGLILTVFHHFMQENHIEDKKQLVYYSCTELIPWIRTKEISNKKLRRWLKFHFSYIKRFPNGFNRFYRCIFLEYVILKMKNSIKDFITKI